MTQLTTLYLSTLLTDLVGICEARAMNRDESMTRSIAALRHVSCRGISCLS